ncbi:MAG: restriction endonuclease [Stellaceae bacterium]
MADILYEFLPGSGNLRLAFPIAATQVGVDRHWTPGSKRPAITQLLQGTYAHDSHKFCALIEAVVRQSLTWRRGKGVPLRRTEIEALNAVLLRIGFKIPGLHDPAFLAALDVSKEPGPMNAPAPKLRDLPHFKLQLVELGRVEAHRRGIQFERFLADLFAEFELAPKGSIRLVGEQIDGSFELGGATYLLEAKWHNDRIGNGDLLTFSGKVARKAKWARGLFVSYSGFTEDGLSAFTQGKQTNIVCVGGLDLFHILDGRHDLREVISRKVRLAAESNRAFIPVREIFSNVV